MGKMYASEKFTVSINRQFFKELTCWFCWALIILSPVFCSASTMGPREGMIISIDADKSRLKDVLSDIYRQTEWKIVLDESLTDSIITGTFKEIELESFLKRALKGENLIFLYDEEAKTIDVRVFGATETNRARAAEVSEDILPDEKTLQALRAEENRIFEEYISDPNSIEPLTGMTLGEIAALQAEEEKIHNAYISNPDSIEPLTGMTLGEISALHAAEQEIYEKYINDPSSVEVLTGISFAEIDALHAQEKMIGTQEEQLSIP
jgi:hypothetical protein